jgi:hypothetical protein
MDSEEESERLEHKKREDAVLGIIVASALGVVLNLLSNLYYELFIVRRLTWDKVDHMQVYGLGLLLVAFVGFLKFFILDYKNGLELDRSFLKRFSNYFFYEFRPGKIIRVIFGLYMLFILVGLLILSYILMAQVTGYIIATLVFLLAVGSEYIKSRKRQNQMS